MDDDRLISLNAALDALPKKQKGIGGESWMKTYRRSGYNDCVEDCMKALQALPSAQPGWIPCSVMLPENDGEYLVTLRAITQLQKACAKIDIARFDGKWHKAYPVVAWMPLPKPWEGGQDERSD